MTTQEKVRKQRRIYSAMEKCQAILSLWSERRKPSVICKDLGVNWAVLNSWEKRGINGALKALGGPEECLTEQVGLGLGTRLEKLLEIPVKPQEVKSEPESK